jgi:hypothetical protein
MFSEFSENKFSIISLMDVVELEQMNLAGETQGNEFTINKMPLPCSC